MQIFSPSVACPFISLTVSLKIKVFTFDEIQFGYFLSFFFFLAFIVHGFFVLCLRNVYQSQGYYSCFLLKALSSHSPGDLPNPGIKPTSPACGRLFTTETPGKPIPSM